MTYSPDVAAQQTALNKQGANLKVDGFLGPLTQAAITKYTPGPTIDNNALVPNGAKPISNTPSVSPVTKPTSVISTTPAVNQVNQAKNILTTASSTNQNLYNATNGFVTPYGLSQGAKPVQPNDPAMAKDTTIGSTDTSKTNTNNAEDTILNTPETGHQFAYSPSGDRVEVPLGTNIPDGYSTNKPAVVATATLSSGSSIKQMADGSYGLYGVDGSYVGPSSAGQFNAINSGQSALKAFNDFISSGGTTLNSAQQAQLTATKDQYASLIAKQETTNANATGVTTIAENMYGMGNTLTGHGEITQTINDGISKITDLTSKMNSDIANMTLGFEKDNLEMVKAGFDAYQTNSKNLQSSIDTFQATVQKQTQKTTDDQASVNNAYAKKYQDTSIPILPTDTAADLKAKLETSETWKQDHALKISLTNEENAYFADMLTSGFSISKILPNLGYGTAGTAAKIAVLKPMIEKAMKAGLSGQEFGNAMIDKTSKAAAFSKLETKKDLIESNEKAVINDFDKILKPAAKEFSKAEWNTMSPKLNEWLQTGILASTGDTKLNNYLGSLTTTLTKYSNVVAGNIGAAGATQQMNTEIQGLLRRGLGYDALVSYIDTIAKPEMNNTVTGFSDTQNQIKDNLNELDGTFSQGSTQNSISNSSNSSAGSSGGIFDF